MDEAAWLRVISGADASARAGALRCVLAAVEPIYAGAMRGRNYLYHKHLLRSVQLARPVVSVGNLTTGGTGKTPMVIELARRAAAMGAAPGVLLRGYKGEGQAAGSDEAALYKEALAEVGGAVAADPNRVRGADRLLSAWPGVGVLLLDDGFQHRRVARDLDLVLVDATRPWGGGRVLPRGLLREPMAGLARADGVIITRADAVPATALEQIMNTVHSITGRPAMAQAAHAWTGWRAGLDDEATAAPTGPVVAAVGIGNPAAFEASLRKVCDVKSFYARPDHHAYDASELRSLLDEADGSGGAGGSGGDCLVTTEKDFVKWRPLLESDAALRERAERVVRPVLGINWLAGEQAVDAALRGVLASRD